MPTALAGYRGPLVVVGIGAGLAAVGAVPVAITFSTGVQTPAKIIGMGFVGFGILLMTPGLVWCIVIKIQRSFKSWRYNKDRACACADDRKCRNSVGSLSTKKDTTLGDTRNADVNDEGERTPALGRPSTQQRPKCWPATYVDPPPLIITDNGVRRATTPTPNVTTTTVTLTTNSPLNANDNLPVCVVIDSPSSTAANDVDYDVIVDLAETDDVNSSHIADVTPLTQSSSFDSAPITTDVSEPFVTNVS